MGWERGNMEIPSSLNSCVPGKDCKDFVLGRMDWWAGFASFFVKITPRKAEICGVRCCQITLGAELQGFQSSLLFTVAPWSCLGQWPPLGHFHRIQQQVEGTALSHLMKMQVRFSPYWSPGMCLETSEKRLCCVLGSCPSQTAAWGKAFHMLQLPSVTSHHVTVTYINFTPNKRGDNTWGHKCSLCGEGTAHGKQSGGKARASLLYFDLSF